MKRFFIGITVLLFGVVLSLNVAFAALSPLGTTWSADDTREVNKATPGTDKAFLGTYSQGPVGTVGSTTYASGENLNTTGKCVNGSSSSFTTPTTTAFFKTTGALTGESYCLGDAVIPGTTTPAYNQRLTITLVTDGGKDFVVTPATKTGFSNIVLDDAKDSVTLRYIDHSKGWQVEGNAGATIN